MGKLWQDIRYAFRAMQRNPGFALVAILTLAIGIGANVAIFSVVNGVLLEPVPFPHPDRLVLIWETDMNRNVLRGRVSAAELLDWRDTSHSFDQLAGWSWVFYTITGGRQPERVWGCQVTANFFRLLGVAPVLGRDFQTDDEQPGHEQVAILSYRFWQGHFGGDPSAIGQFVRIDDKPYTVIGVLPRDFAPVGIPSELDVWTPFAFVRSRLDPQDHELIILGRMRPRVTLPQAQAEMETILAALKKQHPTFDQKIGVRVVTFQSDLVRRQRSALLLLMGAVGFVLLIACANVANLTLARAAGREREIAVRAALGAGRRRILRQLLTESVLLALIGGIAGIAVAYGGIAALKALSPPPGAGPQMPFMDRIGVNGQVLGFALMISLATGILSGLAPAVQISRAGINESLKEGSRGSTGGRQSRWMRSALVVSEVGLSLMLLAGAGLLIHSFVLMLDEKLGFDPSNLLTMQVYLPESHYQKAPQIDNFYQQVIGGMSALPGVASASAVDYLPLTGWNGYCDFDIAGRPLAAGEHHGRGNWLSISPHYFDVFRIPLIRGRVFTERDDRGGMPVVIINRTMARQFWGDRDPLHERIRIGKGYGPQFEDTVREIVGVVGDTRNELSQPPDPAFYVPVSQVPDAMTAFMVRLLPVEWVVRTRVEPHSLRTAIGEELEHASGGLPAGSIRTMDEIASESTAREDFDMSLLSVFGGVALLLAAIGIYGLMAYSVQQRTQEIGIRLALGAGTGAVRNMVVFEGMRLALAGVALGLVAALALTKLLSGFLYGVQPRDPLVFVTVPLLLSAVALVSVWLPARRATRIDPIRALRYE